MSRYTFPVLLALSLLSVLIPSADILSAEATNITQDARGMTVAGTVNPQGQRIGVATTTVKQGKRWCLLIGCDSYSNPNIPNLKWAEKDIADIEKALITKKRGLFTDECVTVLKGTQVTRKRVLDALRSISTNAVPGDFVYIHYSGHGALDSVGTALQGKLRAYLVMHDTDPANLKVNGLSMQEFNEDILNCPATEVVLFLDACHSGAAGAAMAGDTGTQRVVLSPTAQRIIQQQNINQLDNGYNSWMRAGRHLVTACRDNQLAREDPRYQNGLLTYYLLQAIYEPADPDGDRSITFNEAYNAIYAGISQYTPVDNSGEVQVPEKYEAGSDPYVPLAWAVTGNVSAKEAARFTTITALRKRLSLGQWEDSSPGLAKDIAEFVSRYPDDPFAATATRALHRHEFNIVKERIRDIALNPKNPESVGAYKKKALDILTVFENTHQDSGLLPAVSARAAEILNIGKNGEGSRSTVKVPGGTFTMGRNIGGVASEQPAISIRLNKFVIDRYEVTNEQYADFIAADGYANKEYWSEEGWEWKQRVQAEAPHFWDDPDLGRARPKAPVVGVSWYEAEAFAKFRGKAQLPTEAEWERAARGTDRRDYPWGNAPCFDATSDTSRANYDAPNDFPDGYTTTASVKAFESDTSPSGCRQMGGNVAEWCLDTYREDFYRRTSAFVDPVCRDKGGNKVIRGGAWSRPLFYMTTTQRDWADPSMRLPYVGFRLVHN